ncbi:OmpA domain-containing protein [Corallococcus coralloides]|uniref:OmpA domain-containing protein n=1 Tax=Corallococcus coralloides TaxID=184914 RepID=A0A410S3T5_CORCK|nr:MYXO-CTERM sorting domain-containing protein [Corallococcus coralloides]QAT88738.1 OmpA domain-containing protein [Corallococcus coralloides]
MRITLALIVGLLLAQVARAEPDSFELGTGRDGVLSLTVGQGVALSSHAPLGRSVAEGGLELVVSGLEISAGDLVMIHESTGLSSAPDVGNAGPVSLTGSVTLGRWELARVEKVSSTTPALLTLTAPLRYAYATGRAQVVRVAEYSDVVIQEGARLTVSPWNGQSGGILAMLVSGKVVNDGRIDADGQGSLGGVFQTDAADLNGCTALELELGKGGSARGEGVAGTASRSGLSTGRGNLANGGGGGNCAAAGGGGGGHGGVGGIGGRTATGDGSREQGGLGGAALSYSVFERFTFGGGGGAGQGSDAAGSNGAAGGGVVFIRATAFDGKGVYSASGSTAGASTGNDGAGGGGAGGAVVLRAVDLLNCGGVEARGGAGGNTQLDTQPFGPGGGGAGGRILLEGKTLACAPNASAGSAGVSAYPGADSYGAGPDRDPSTGGTSMGTVQEVAQSFQVPVTPVITAPVPDEASTTTRPRFEGAAGTTGPVVHIVVDGREIGATVPGADGRFTYAPAAPLSAGVHDVVAWAESLGVASRPSTPVRFTTPAVVLADGGVVQMAVLVVPSNGDTVGPTPLFAGTAPNGNSVGVVIDDGEDIIVPLDLLGRFRYQVPDSAPLSVGTHKVTVHSHNEAGDDGPYSDVVGFEVVVAGSDGGTDAGTVDPATPMVLVPEEGATVDPTFMFVGVALPGTTVRLELDGTALATATADDEGVFRHVLTADTALATGAHKVVAQVVTAQGEAGLRSPEVGFQVRGPTDLDVGCGCGSAPAGMISLWALVGLGALVRRRRMRS